MPTGKQDTARPPLARLVVFDELSGRKQKMSPSLVVSTDRTLVVPPPPPPLFLIFFSRATRCGQLPTLWFQTSGNPQQAFPLQFRFHFLFSLCCTPTSFDFEVFRRSTKSRLINEGNVSSAKEPEFNDQSIVAG